mmetsp:Transcript_15090/g.22225  ORF Transcript_15090/g.22225 Transcript_15090/m.22225 type:complete len:100 (-) Transcript_15090:2408-2707(-)
MLTLLSNLNLGLQSSVIFSHGPVKLLLKKWWRRVFHGTSSKAAFLAWTGLDAETFCRIHFIVRVAKLTASLDIHEFLTPPLPPIGQQIESLPKWAQDLL